MNFPRNGILGNFLRSGPPARQVTENQTSPACAVKAKPSVRGLNLLSRGTRLPCAQPNGVAHVYSGL
jgi:hypothetical protein